MKCRFCNNKLKYEFIDLIASPPSNSFLTKAQLNEPEVYYPLKLFVCDKCFLVQIAEYKNAKEIFDSEYIYFSSYSKSWLAHAKAYTEKMIDRFGYNENSLIVEIASNDGYLLQYFKEKNILVFGIEPTENTANVAKEKGIETIVDFFGIRLAKKLINENKRADLLIGNNVLAHVPDINDFVGGLRILLNPTGVITMEFPHLVKLIENNQFDTIYHEHFSYLSFTTVERIFKSYHLTIFDVEELSTHGGSLRIFAKHTNDSSKVIASNVNKLLEKEKKIGIDSINYYGSFQHQIYKIKNNLLDFLLQQKKQGKLVVAYGAAAKGNTLLNYCGIKPDLLPFVVDASPYKQGKFLPGNHIPVVNENVILKHKPEFILVLPWNIKDEIMEQLKYITEWKGKFVIPIPELTILYSLQSGLQENYEVGSGSMQ